MVEIETQKATSVLAGVLTPGEWAIVPLIPIDPYRSTSPLVFNPNWMDSRIDERDEIVVEIPNGCFLIETKMFYEDCHLKTDLGNLRHSGSYMAVPLEDHIRSRTSEYCNHCWLHLDITEDTEVRVSDKNFSVGSWSLDPEICEQVWDYDDPDAGEGEPGYMGEYDDFYGDWV